ncbi:MAG: hypothetical protein KGJ98_12615 [Chloroflexota bacterium]|nr:hypothetical protein [Chloroflexota bacterium]MDE3103064.1 hypothetical protein [Chloroflexota bacterium]
MRPEERGRVLSSSERTELLVERLLHEGEAAHVRLELTTAALAMSVILNGEEAEWLSRVLGDAVRAMGVV